MFKHLKKFKELYIFFTVMFTLMTAFYVPIFLIKDETPPHWQEICVNSKTELEYKYAPFQIGIGNGSFKFVPVTTCLETRQICVAGKHYQGIVSCQKN